MEVVRITGMEQKYRREELEDLVSVFFKKHPLAKSCGGEYIHQNDEAQVDAIELVSEICELYCEKTENN